MLWLCTPFPRVNALAVLTRTGCRALLKLPLRCLELAVALLDPARWRAGRDGVLKPPASFAYAPYDLSSS
jgi:hypothetical protein